MTLWLLLIAFVRPSSIDESQYVAATALVAHGQLPYRDFAYLQTPLQPFVLAPLQWLFAGYLFLALRIANATLAVATIVLVYFASCRAGATERAALAASTMLIACQSFIWCAGVARNDVLPAALMTLALVMLAKPGVHWMRIGAGVAFGLAASAKISYAVPAAAVFLGGILTRDAAERRRFVWFAVGLGIGLLPTLFLAALAPRAFLAEAIRFPAEAPTLYYAEIGKAWRLGPSRFGQLLIAATVGPALIASVEVVRCCSVDPRRWFGDPARRTMLAAAVGGLLSACLNRPFQIYYLLPALPPLFVLTALLFSEGKVRPQWLPALWALFIAGGFVPVIGWFGRAAMHGMLPALEVQLRSRALGAALRAHHVEDTVASLTSQYIPDSGYSADPRFAAGPFLYRTTGFVSAEDAREYGIVTRDQAAVLAKPLPGAIVTGINPDKQLKLEARLSAQAAALGYTPVGQVDGFTIWTRSYRAGSPAVPSPPLDRP
ncbi:MAG: hypothetical protein JF595_17510 [Sphingomonadales bacterium]|nr:hypothetical protein [Sphingomonadales bacterium]